MELKLFHCVVHRHNDHKGFHATVLAFDKVEAEEYLHQEVKNYLPGVPLDRIDITELVGPFKSGRVLCRVIL